MKNGKKNRRENGGTRSIFTLIEKAALLIYEVRLAHTLQTPEQTKMQQAQSLLEKALGMLRGRE